MGPGNVTLRLGSFWGSATSLVLAAAVSFSAPMPVVAQTECGAFYRVQRGDTLRSITILKLRHDRYQELFDANRDVLVNPGRIEVGQLLYIPCRGDGPQTRSAALSKIERATTARDDVGDRLARQTGARPPAPLASEVPAKNTVNRVVTRSSKSSPQVEPASADVAPVVKPDRSASVGEGASKRTAHRTAFDGATEPGSAPDAQGNPVRVLMASDMVPLTHRDLPHGGLLPLLMTSALETSGARLRPLPAFVEDRKAHLDVLMPTAAFGLAAPWPAPDCTAPALGTDSAALCRDFLFSRPLFEVEIVTLVRKQNAGSEPANPATWAGQRVCRPLDFPAVDLEALRPMPTIVRARERSGCLELLLSQQVDAVSLPRPLARAISAPGLVEALDLSRTIPVHAIAWRADPAAAETIAALDNGLTDLQASGAWFSMVSGYMSDFNRRTQAGQ